MRVIALIALILYVLYGVAFYAEGYRAQGGPALKALAISAELAIYAALIWVLQS